MKAYCGLCLYFIIVNEVDYDFHMLPAQSFHLFFSIKLPYHILLICHISLYVPHVNPYSVIDVENIFSQFVNCAFTLFMHDVF